MIGVFQEISEIKLLVVETGNIAVDDSFIAEARKIFGSRLDLNPGVLKDHSVSETHIHASLPDAVAFAQTKEEVVALVRLCGDRGIPVTPFGVGTSLEGNAIPARGGISLDMSRMDRIVCVNQDDFDCTVQPGVLREQLNLHLRDMGLFFPIDPGANASIGGMVGTRASGTSAVRYGTMRDATLALEVVLANGNVIKTASRARKSAAGYDLTRLMVGSEGTLGVVTEVTLRLHGIPERIAAATCGFASVEGAVQTVVQSMQLGIPLAKVEFLDDVQMRAINAWSGMSLPEVTTLFFEFHGSTRHVEEQIETVTELANASGGTQFQWATLPEDRARLWKARHDAYYASLALKPGSVGWPTDVTVPISRLPECLEETKRDLAGSTATASIVGHVGDGNFHVIFVLDPDNPADTIEAQRLNDRLIQRAIDMDGTCTGEHGIGLGKQRWLEVELGNSVDAMRTIKRALDPLNILNPGKIFTL